MSLISNLKTTTVDSKNLKRSARNTRYSHPGNLTQTKQQQKLKPTQNKARTRKEMSTGKNLWEAFCQDRRKLK